MPKQDRTYKEITSTANPDPKGSGCLSNTHNPGVQPDSVHQEVTRPTGTGDDTNDPSTSYTDTAVGDTPIPITIHRMTRSEGMYVEAQVNGTNVVFAIDTGASKTVISKTVFQSIPESQRPTLLKTTGLTGASGKPLRHYGTANFSLRLGSVEMNREMIVADIEDEGLLGHDLLLSGTANIQYMYGKGILHIMGVSIPCIQVGGLPAVRKVRTADHFIIPSRSEAIIDVFVDGKDTGSVVDRSNIIIEPSSAFQERYNVAMASSLCDAEANVTHQIRLMNPSVTDVSINQDVVVGTAEIIVGEPHVIMSMENKCERENRQVPHIRRVQHQHVPDHLKSLYDSACSNRSEEEQARIAKTLMNFQDSFSKDEYDLGLTHLIEHCIDVGDHGPIKQAPRRVPIAFASEEENVIKRNGKARHH